MSASWSVNQLASRAVALHGPGSLSERRELLDMLGLVTPEGTIADDDYRFIELHPPLDNGSVERSFLTLREPNMDRSNVPVGLVNFEPHPPKPTPAEKPVKTKVRGDAQCGTVAGRARHVRLHQAVCRPCKDAHNAYSAANKAKHRAQKVAVDPNRPDNCGSLAGRSNHARRGEKPCRACKDALNTYQRSRRVQRVPPEERSA